MYAVDARNHGKSDHVAQMDYALMSRDTIEFCREHQLERVSIIGTVKPPIKDTPKEDKHPNKGQPEYSCVHTL